MSCAHCRVDYGTCQAAILSIMATVEDISVDRREIDEQIINPAAEVDVTVEAAVLRESHFLVREIITRPVREHPGNSLYAEVNFFIRSSKVYFQNHSLREYLQCYPWLYPFVLVASIFAFLHNIFAVVLVISNFVFLVIYIQHLIVSITTMRHVLLQPYLPDCSKELQGNCNMHLKITYEQYKVGYAKAGGAEIGIISGEAGMIQLQLFSLSTRTRMQRGVTLSTVYLIFSGLMLFYSLTWAISLILRCGLCGSSHDVEGNHQLAYYVGCCVTFAIAELLVAIAVCVTNAKSVCRACLKLSEYLNGC